MDMIKMLPQEIENKIFYMVAEHPLATIFKKHVDIATSRYDDYHTMFIKNKDNVRSRILVDVDDEELTEVIDYLRSENRHDNLPLRINSMRVCSIEKYNVMLKMFDYKII